MKQRNPDISFSAYAGTDEEPRHARRQQAQPARRSAAGKTDAQVSRTARRVWILLLVMMVATGALLVQNRDLVQTYINRPVVNIRMETPLHRVQEADIRTILARFTNEGFFSMNVTGLKQALEDNPWVEQAVIRRVWPDTLAVAIHEEVAIARWGDDSLLNQYGSIFSPEDLSAGQSLPLLDGPEDSETEMMQQYQSFTQMLLTTGLRIRALELSSRGSWSLTFDNEVSLHIGRDQVVERMQRFIAFYDRQLHKEFEQVSAIDLRYRNGMAVRMKSTPSGVAAT